MAPPGQPDAEVEGLPPSTSASGCPGGAIGFPPDARVTVVEAEKLHVHPDHLADKLRDLLVAPEQLVDLEWLQLDNLN
eukprot:5213800-Prorocentrum_lima.AAC.1